ncbi:MAG: type II secretion system GspH family protein [Burkholderiales bacterium]|nr:type II secretion system GspH family protein [Burkholderiales bacterium]
MRRQRGFTLIEMMITVVIIAILALGLVPLGELAAQRSKESELRTALRQIRGALDAYKKAGDDGRIERKADQSGYPPTLELLAEGVADQKTPEKKLIYFLRRIPRDPFFGDNDTPAAKTWGLRSYESAPDSPRSGKDVFDVYSLADGKGLNGVPYRQW